MKARSWEDLDVDDDGYDDGPFYGNYQEPPLYPDGKLASMSVDELNREIERQSNIHDAAVDRCEDMNSPTIETARFRWEACEHELRRRGVEPTPFTD
jgi:hypothetical protein